jgi:3-oxoadipate enol-lactonase
VVEHVRKMIVGTHPEGAAAALRGRAARRPYAALLSRVAVPTAVLVGRDDEFTPVSVAQSMSERIPKARFVVIHGTGHLPNLERPAAFNSALEQFLDHVLRTVTMNMDDQGASRYQ